MQGTMRAYQATADWAPKPDYKLSEREIADQRSYRADYTYKNVSASIKNVDIPQIKEDEILIRVGACGICGSDHSALGSDAEGYSTFSSHMRFPVILGHEYCGEAVEVGSKIKGVKPGDIIVSEQCRWCGTCRMCRAGMFNQCENFEENGLTTDGGFAEYAMIPEKFICVANGLLDACDGDRQAAFEAGALVEPTAVAYSGIQINAGGIKPGSYVAVFGCGPIGLASIILAKAFGAAKVFAFNTNPARDQLAWDMGADYVQSPRELAAQGTSAGDFVMEHTDGLGAGMIIEATGKFSAVYPDIIKCIGAGAKVLQLGIGPTPVTFDGNPLLRKNASIIGSLGHAGSDIFPSVIRMMESGVIDCRKMITGRYNLDKTGEAIDDSAKRELGHGKIMVSQFY